MQFSLHSSLFVQALGQIKVELLPGQKMQTQLARISIGHTSRQSRPSARASALFDVLSASFRALRSIRIEDEDFRQHSPHVLKRAMQRAFAAELSFYV